MQPREQKSRWLYKFVASYHKPPILSKLVVTVLVEMEI